MSAGSRPMPLGFSFDHPQRQGLAPTAGGWSPGPVSPDKYVSHAAHLHRLAGAVAPALRDFLKIELALGADRYRLRRAGMSWSAGATAPASRWR